MRVLRRKFRDSLFYVLFFYVSYVANLCGSPDKHEYSIIFSFSLRYIVVMQWTDKIRQVKIMLCVAAIVLAVLSLVVSH